jgi:PilZ domain
MIWLMTIVAFLGVVAAAMLVFFFLFDKEKVLAVIRDLRQRRTEERVPTIVGLELSGPDELPVYEVTFTENVSRHGVRVVTKKRFSPNDNVLVKLPQECLPTRARITYCQQLKEDAFALGLRFSLPVYSWTD